MGPQVGAKKEDGRRLERKRSAAGAKKDGGRFEQRADASTLWRQTDPGETIMGPQAGAKRTRKPDGLAAIDREVY